MTNQPDSLGPDYAPDPAAPPRIAADGTSTPGGAYTPQPAGTGTPGRTSTPGGTGTPRGTGTPGGTAAPVSGQPWPTPSGNPLSPDPYPPPPPATYAPTSYSPGYAPVPEPSPDYPPTSQFPAQALPYAPPGYAPDYGHGYPPPAYAGPPGYGQPPAAPPPPRKSNVPIIAVILAVTLLLCGGIATAGVLVARNVTNKAKEVVGNLPTALPELPLMPTDLPTVPPGLERTITVTYEVSGDGPVGIVYLEKLGDAPVRLENVKLPWKFTAEVQTPAVLSVVAIRAGTAEGTVSCTALVDGDEVKQHTSGEGNFATASCTYFALD